MTILQNLTGHQPSTPKVPIGGLTYVRTTTLPSYVEFSNSRNNMDFSPDGNYFYIAGNSRNGTVLLKYNVTKSTGDIAFTNVYAAGSTRAGNYVSIGVTSSNVYATAANNAVTQLWGWDRNGDGTLSNATVTTGSLGTSLYGWGFTPDYSRVFVGTNKGLTAYDVSGKSFSPIAYNGGGPASYNLWAGSGDNRQYINPSSWNNNCGYATVTNSTDTTYLASVAIAPNGPQIYYGSDTYANYNSIFMASIFATISGTTRAYVAFTSSTGVKASVSNSVSNYASANASPSSTISVDTAGYAIGIAMSPDQLSLYITNQQLGKIYSYAVSGTTLTKLAGAYGDISSGSSYSNSCVVVSPDNNYVYVFDSNNFTVICYSRNH